MLMSLSFFLFWLFKECPELSSRGLEGVQDSPPRPLSWEPSDFRTSFVVKLNAPCYVERYEYYTVAKVFTRIGDDVYFIHNNRRNTVVKVDLMAKGYPETLIELPFDDAFQLAYDGSEHLLALSEKNAQVAYLDVARSVSAGVVQLTAGMIYRTMDSNRGLVVVNGIKNHGDWTENVQILIGRDQRVAASHIISFEGGHLGKYIHKLKMVYSKNGRLLIGMVSHHYEYANFYVLGVNEKQQLTILYKREHLHERWIWDLHHQDDSWFVSSSDGNISIININ